MEVPDTAELYDPATNVWSPPAHQPLFKHIHWFTTVLLQGPRCSALCGKVLVAGGEGTAGQPGVSEVYDPLSETWTATGPLTTPRVEHVTALLDGPACAGSSPPAYCGDVLVAGGYTPSSSFVTTDTAELFDPAATDPATGLLGAWRPTASLAPIASLPYAPGLATAAVLTGPRCGAHCGQVVIAGGVGSSLSAGLTSYRAAELYDPASGTWSVAAALSGPRFDYAGVLLPSGDYLVAGGNTGFGVTATAELYDPAASGGTWAPAPPMSNAGSAFATTVLSAGPASTCGTRCGGALVTGGGMSVAEIFEGLPAVGSVAPDPVPLAGASTKVSGGGFTTADQVTIDKVPIPCPSAACAKDPASPDTTLDVTFPPHAAGMVPVEVRNKIGDSPLPAFLVRYADPMPTLAALSPGCGPVAGGTTVVITGTNFTPAATVDVAGTGVPATVLSSTAVRFTSPSASTAGGVPVTVTTSGGTSSPLTFTYPCALAAAAGAPAAAGFVPTSAQTGAQPPAYPQPPPAAQVPPATAATVATAASHGPVAAAGQSVGGIAGVGADDPAGVPALRYGMARHEDWSVSPPLVAAGAAMLGAFGFCLFTGASPAARIRRRSAITPAPAPARTEEITR